MNIFIVNGPNLNLLGEREPEVYGTETLAEINAWIARQVPEVEFKFYQSNHEGALIDAIHANRHWANGMVINAGAYTHYSIALRDAISSAQLPTVEVHLSDIHAREDFRKISVIEDVCITQICGHGKQGYVMAVKTLSNHLS